MKLEEDKKLRCRRCGVQTSERASVSVRVTDPWKRYVHSGRAFVRTANTKLCKKCYKKFMTDFEKVMHDY